MKVKIFRNWGLKLLSLAIAFVIWFLVVQINDPKDTSSFSNIQVKITNTDLLENANKVYEILDNTDRVRVTVRAPRSILQEIRSGDIVAEADVSKLTDINTIAITYDIENVDMASVEITGNHNVVKLNVEEKRRKYIQVDYKVVGEVSEGFILGNISLEQNRIEISGPQSAVDQVKNAFVEIDVDNATSSLSADLELHMNNTDNEEVTLNNLNKQMDYIHVSAEVLPTKSVPVVVAYQGTPAQGYIVTGDPLLEPTEILVAGSQRVLLNLSAITIPAKDIDISDAEATVEVELAVSDYLPSTVRLAESGFDGKLKVQVPIERILNMTLRVPVSNITFANIPEGLEVEASEADRTVDLEVSGLSEYVSMLRGTNVYGTVDVKAWMEEQELEELSTGEYSLPVVFTLDEHITSGIIPEVQVTISEQKENTENID